MMQLVRDCYVAREVNHDESLTETLMEWFSRRPSLRDVTVFVADGVATLRGSVPTNRDRALAILGRAARIRPGSRRRQGGLLD